jgi:hypothetical protein
MNIIILLLLPIDSIYTHIQNVTIKQLTECKNNIHMKICIHIKLPQKFLLIFLDAINSGCHQRRQIHLDSLETTTNLITL